MMAWLQDNGDENEYAQFEDEGGEKDEGLLEETEEEVVITERPGIPVAPPAAKPKPRKPSAAKKKARKPAKAKAKARPKKKAAAKKAKKPARKGGRKKR
jgi:hypothetical protein